MTYHSARAERPKRGFQRPAEGLFDLVLGQEFYGESWGVRRGCPAFSAPFHWEQTRCFWVPVM